MGKKAVWISGKLRESARDGGYQYNIRILWIYSRDFGWTCDWLLPFHLLSANRRQGSLSFLFSFIVIYIIAKRKCSFVYCAGHEFKLRVFSDLFLLQFSSTLRPANVCTAIVKLLMENFRLLTACLISVWNSITLFNDFIFMESYAV